jgi:hypothetical protein
MPGNPLSDFYYPAIPMAQRVIAAAAISSTYSIIGSIFSTAPIMVIIISTLDQTVQFSWDGVTDAFPVIANVPLIINLKTNKVAISGNYGAYVKEIGNPTTGSLYVGGFTV